MQFHVKIEYEVTKVRKKKIARFSSFSELFQKVVRRCDDQTFYRTKWVVNQIETVKVHMKHLL